MTRHTRHRLQIAILVITCLLFQQVALAAYFCPLEQMPAEMAAMTEHCAEMGMTQKEDNPALCQKHCSPDQSVAADSVKLTVPALALPVAFTASIQTQPSAHAAHSEALPSGGVDPPPRLRFCSLLI